MSEGAPALTVSSFWHAESLRRGTRVMVGKTISHYRVLDSGVNWNRIAFEAPVIPAKAGIQSVAGAFPMARGRDSRFRGNDFAWGRPFLANDTTTGFSKSLAAA